MTIEEAKKFLEAKLKCLIAETSGTNYDCNMRLCEGCDLNYEQGNIGEQKEALELAIKALKATDPSRFTMAEIQPSEDCTNEEEVTYIILNIARNLEHICEVMRNDKGRS